MEHPVVQASCGTNPYGPLRAALAALEMLARFTSASAPEFTPREAADRENEGRGGSYCSR